MHAFDNIILLQSNLFNRYNRFDGITIRWLYGVRGFSYRDFPVYLPI